MLSDIKSLERKGSLDEKTLSRIENFKKSAAKKQANRKSPTSDYIKNNLIQEIKKLREDGFSWRQIERFVRINHKKKISHTLLREVFIRTAQELI
jgi:nucleosome binding factor SPN SPT16 subunit